MATPFLQRYGTKRHLLLPLRRFRRWLSGRYPPPNARIFAACDGTVSAGPFKGMRYISRAVGSALPPKLLGTYEREIHPWLEDITRADYRDIHVIGCAEGYYAVGLALRIPGCRVFAYDLEPSAAPLLRLLAARNGVGSQVEFRGEFTVDSFVVASGERTLIVCDIEGAELGVLQPHVNPALLRADIVVEVHDAATGAIEKVLCDRFAATHDVRRVVSAPRSIGDVTVPLPPSVSKQKLANAIDEGRTYGLTWLFMTVCDPPTPAPGSPRH